MEVMPKLGDKSEHEERIIRIKHLAYCSNDPTVQIRAIDALAAYGNQAIIAITDVINLPNIDDKVKAHGLETIEDIKKKL
jgi:hypothetical protein